jgi:hypothetical protein
MILSRSRIHERTISLRFSGHHLESSQTWGSYLDFLNRRKKASGWQIRLLFFCPD